MQFNVMKRKIDAKIKASLLICLFVAWSLFTMRHTMNSSNITILVLLVITIFLLLHPYLLKLFTILRLRLWNSRITEYEYIEIGENGLYFRYPDLDLRLDTNISEIVIDRKGYDYIFGFGNNRKFLIPTEKPSEWMGNDHFSFMFLAKTIAKNHAFGIPIRTSGKWKITDVKDKILSGSQYYKISKTESSLTFARLFLDKNFLIIESVDNSKPAITINSSEITFIYEVKCPKTNYWLNIFGQFDKYLIISIGKNWFVCKI